MYGAGIVQCGPFIYWPQLPRILTVTTMKPHQTDVCDGIHLWCSMTTHGLDYKSWLFLYMLTWHHGMDIRLWRICSTPAQSCCDYFGRYAIVHYHYGNCSTSNTNRWASRVADSNFIQIVAYIQLSCCRWRDVNNFENCTHTARVYWSKNPIGLISIVIQ